MAERPTWLPSLICLEDFTGDWYVYIEALYGIFIQNFVTSSPMYKGVPISLKKYPLIDGKEATFWHLISEGYEESSRKPDIQRCERLPWPRPVIEHHYEISIKVWENVRKGEISICLWLESEEYLVILRRRNGYILIWTAYVVSRHHHQRKLQKEYEECKGKILYY